MKPCCGIRTIKGAIAWGAFLGEAGAVVQLIRSLKNFSDNCTDGESECTKQWLAITGISLAVIVFSVIVIVIIRECLILCFPVACGHRRCIFTGKSSKTIQDILLSVDKEIPTGDQLQEFKEKALLYLNDIKTEFENILTTTTFTFIFSGSAIERYGVPFMLSRKPKGCCCNSSCDIDALYTDLDVMFCSVVDKACFSGQGNVLVEPLVAEGVGFIGYANLSSLTPGFEGSCVSSKLIREQAKSAVENASVSNLPGVPCCCGMTELTPKIKLDSAGPAMKIDIVPLFEVDITLCIHCPEWPTLSDWPSRPRYWPM